MSGVRRIVGVCLVVGSAAVRLPIAAVRLQPQAVGVATQRAPACRLCDASGAVTSEPKVSIKVKVKTPTNGASPPPATPPAEQASDAKVSISVKGPKAGSAAVVTAPPSAPVVERPPEEEELLEATQTANSLGLLDALQKGANPNIRDPKGRTPLHFMCGIGLAPACVLLIHFGANLEARDESGLTPLHMAAGYANAQCVRVLIAAGADVDAVTDRGTAFEVVKQLGEYQYEEVWLKRKDKWNKLKKTDEKLEKLKKCALYLDEPQLVRDETEWDDLLIDVLKVIQKDEYGGEEEAAADNK